MMVAIHSNGCPFYNIFFFENAIHWKKRQFLFRILSHDCECIGLASSPRKHIHL